jgi:hypothetical protein
MKATTTAWVKNKGSIEGTKVVLTKKQPTDRFVVEFQDKGVKNLTESGDDELESHFGK